LLTTVFSLLSHAQDRSAIITMNNSVLMCPHLSVKFKKIFSSKTVDFSLLLIVVFPQNLS